MKKEDLIAFSEGVLNGGSSLNMCFAVCAPLSGYLHFCGVKHTIIEGEVFEHGHFWIEFPSGDIYDPTADQFETGIPRHYYGPQPEMYIKWQ